MTSSSSSRCFNGTPTSPISRSSSEHAHDQYRHEYGPERDPIVIVGLSLLFPQDATTPDGFWDMLIEARCTSTDVPSERWNPDQFYHTNGTRTESMPVRGGHFIKEDISKFDAPFFSISPTDAAAMDPQHRHALEVTYKALENAGIPMEQMNSSKTSVYTACFNNDYHTIATKNPEQFSSYATTGIYPSFLANRISWFYNLRGNSVNVDSACSSGLVALEMACQNLSTGNSSMSIVAGANLLLTPDLYLMMTTTGMLSGNSKSFSFDDRANGYARGEGFAVIILKRLSDAIRDNDTIRAVIRSTGSNQDGRTPGITQPNEGAQADLIRDTYSKAGLDLNKTLYFEAHGTGTAIGDPIEARAFGSVFRAHRSAERPLYVGAVKSNIGHLEGASGLAGLIKAVMVLEKGLIPPNANFKMINPRIDLDFLNVKFPTEPTPWPTDGLRRASINAFGFGGTNAHAIIDDAYNYLRLHAPQANHNTLPLPPRSLAQQDQQAVIRLNSPRSHPDNLSPTSPNPEKDFEPIQHLLVFSAADKNGISRLSDAYKTFFPFRESLRDHFFVKNLAYTLNSRRSLLQYRSFAIINSDDGDQVSDLGSKMSEPQKAASPTGNGLTDEQNRIGYIFTGQGAQWAGMGMPFLVYPVFQQTLHRAQIVLDDFGCTWSILEELIKVKELSGINQPHLSQPLCTVIQIAMTEVLRSFSILPSVVVGHSSGEIAAAYATGAISFRAAIGLAYFRGTCASQLSTTTKAGAMLAVGISEIAVQPYLEQVYQRFAGKRGATVACINSPKSITLSGDCDQIEALKEALDTNHVFARKLHVNIAYHSHHMLAIAEEYRTAIEGILEPGIAGSTRNKTPQRSIVMVSSLHGKLATKKELLKTTYWVDNLTSQVRFAEAISLIAQQLPPSGPNKIDASHLKKEYANVLIEIGPHAVLQGPIRDILSGYPQRTMAYYAIMERGSRYVTELLKVAGTLHCRGYNVNIDAVNRVYPEQRSKVLVNLPSYPFDHSKSYWYEDRLSENFRKNSHNRLDLLGKPVVDWNPHLARWRNFVKVSDMNWVEDHKVSGSIIYPAAGMLVMTVEAAAQLCDQSRAVFGFEFLDVTFEKAIWISNSAKGTEIQICLQPVLDRTDETTFTADFMIHSFGENTNTPLECCHGSVRVSYMTGSAEDDADIQEEMRAYKEEHYILSQRCHTPIDSESLYDHLKARGLEYGPAFQCVDNVAISDDSVTKADITIYDWLENGPSDYRQPHIIHPVTLDGMLHMTMAALMNDKSSSLTTAVPTQIRRLWLSREGLSSSTPDMGKTVKAVSRIKKSGLYGYDATVSVVGHTISSSDVDALRLSIDGLRLTILPGTSQDDMTKSASTGHYCFGVDWKPEPSLLNVGLIRSLNDIHDEAPTDYFQALTFVLLGFVLRTLKDLELSPLKIPSSQPQLHRYIEWLHWIRDCFTKDTLAHTQEEWASLLFDEAEFTKVCDQVSAMSDHGRLYVEVGKALPAVLKGDKNPLSVMIENDMLGKFYDYLNNQPPAYQYMETYLQALAHKNPSMKILEIGAGTGGTSRKVLRNMSASSGLSGFAQYDYTDISPAFFANAGEEFRYQNINFRTLNIESDPAIQGFDLGSYDLIIAANVLHATEDMDMTMKNVRSLLKDNGKIILQECTRPELLRIGFIFGLLPGWWLGKEPFRRTSACMSLRQWQNTLVETGFSGLDLVLQDYKDDVCNEMDFLVSSATLSSSLSMSSEREFLPHIRHLVIVYGLGSPSQLQNALQLQQYLSERSKINLDIRISSLDRLSLDLQDLHGNYFIFLQELDEPLLDKLSEATFSAVKQILLSAKGTLWLTQKLKDWYAKPEFAMIDGLSRVIRNENQAVRLSTLALEINRTLSTAQLDHVGFVLSALSTPKGTLPRDLEPAYMEINSVLHIGRLVQNTQIEKVISESASIGKVQNRPFNTLPAAKLILHSPFRPKDICFVEDDAAKTSLAEHEFEIKVVAASPSLNLRGLSNTAHQSSGSCHYFGIECSGIIVRVGSPDCHLQPGDRVMAYGTESLRTYVRVHADCAYKIQDDLSLIEAASLPADYILASYGLVDHARLGGDDSLLILLGSTSGSQFELGLGAAAIQIAQDVGARIFVSVRTSKAWNFVQEKYKIPSSDIFHGPHSFSRRLMRLTEQKGVNVILNIHASQATVASAYECLAAHGRFVDTEQNNVSSSKLACNATYTSIDASNLALNRPQAVGKILQRLGKMLACRKSSLEVGSSSIPVVKLFTLSELHEAFMAIQAPNRPNKIVLEFEDHHEVPLIPPPRCPTAQFPPDKTYVIAGGLGGLGRSIAKWMVKQGARNLVLLSRSGNSPTSTAAQCFIQELQDEGATVAAPACDISNALSLHSSLQEVKRRMPPIAGCIQATMVLQDALFENMTHEQWTRAIQPKVQGSWNLHEMLPLDLDFFILLSSISGIIGQVGQANYAAGNTYMDALAKYRVTKGLKGMSIALGVMSDSGYLVQNRSTMTRHMKTWGYAIPISDADLFALLHHYCDPQLPLPSSSSEAYVTLGINIPQNVRSLNPNVEQPTWMSYPLFRHLHCIPSKALSLGTALDEQELTATTNAQGLATLAKELSSAQSPADMTSVIAQALKLKLARGLYIQASDIDYNHPMSQYGVDSLLAADLRGWISAKFAVDMPVFEILGASSLVAVAGRICDEAWVARRELERRTV